VRFCLPSRPARVRGPLAIDTVLPGRASGTDARPGSGLTPRVSLLLRPRRRAGNKENVVAYPMAPYAAVQKSTKTAGGSGESIMRWVKRMPIRSLAGSL